MNYELAKELKNAGFKVPPIHEGFWFDEYGQRCGNVHGSTYIPTLEELIEACGEITLQGEGTNGEWRARKVLNHGSTEETQELVVGSTPTEAVARLWLALNKKS